MNSNRPHQGPGHRQKRRRRRRRRRLVKKKGKKQSEFSCLNDIVSLSFSLFGSPFRCCSITTQSFNPCISSTDSLHGHAFHSTTLFLPFRIRILCDPTTIQKTCIGRSADRSTNERVIATSLQHVHLCDSFAAPQTAALVRSFVRSFFFERSSGDLSSSIDRSIDYITTTAATTATHSIDLFIHDGARDHRSDLSLDNRASS